MLVLYASMMIHSLFKNSNNRFSTRKVKNEISSLLKSKLGISLGVELVDKGSTAHLTQIDTRQKAIRLIDERF